MDNHLSLSELSQKIKDAINNNLKTFYWLVAEISEIKVNYSGHCYLELIEKDIDDISIISKIRATIWARNYNVIKPYFETSTGKQLEPGMKILIKAKEKLREGLFRNKSHLFEYSLKKFLEER